MFSSRVFSHIPSLYDCFSTVHAFNPRSVFMHPLLMYLQTMLRRQYYSTLTAFNPRSDFMLPFHMYLQTIFRRQYITTRFTFKFHYSFMYSNIVYPQDYSLYILLCTFFTSIFQNNFYINNSFNYLYNLLKQFQGLLIFLSFILTSDHLFSFCGKLLFFRPLSSWYF